VAGEERGVFRLHAGDDHRLHERHAQHGGLGAGNAAGLAQQHVGRVHVDRHLIRKRYGQHALPVVGVLERLPQRLIPAGQHAQQCVFIRHAADRIAQRHGVAAANAAGHDEIDLLVRRQPQRLQSLRPGLPVGCEAVFALKGAHGAFGRAAVDPVHVSGVVAPIFELGLDLRYDGAARPLFICDRLSGRNERCKQCSRSDERRECETQMPKLFVHIENSFADIWV